MGQCGTEWMALESCNEMNDCGDDDDESSDSCIKIKFNFPIYNQHKVLTPKFYKT